MDSRNFLSFRPRSLIRESFRLISLFSFCHVNRLCLRICYLSVFSYRCCSLSSSCAEFINPKSSPSKLARRVPVAVAVTHLIIKQKITGNWLMDGGFQGARKTKPNRIVQLLCVSFVPKHHQLNKAHLHHPHFFTENTSPAFHPLTINVAHCNLCFKLVCDDVALEKYQTKTQTKTNLYRTK